MNSSSSSSTTAAPAASHGQTTQNGRKRKSPSQLALLRKRIRQYLITCPVAISILRDLGLRSRSTLNSGKFLAWTVDPTDPIFKTIHDYASMGQLGIYLVDYHPCRFGAKILGILRITPGDIPPQFDDNPINRGQLRMMLWKSGRALDIRNALKNGLKVRRANKWQRWGEGYYFSDKIGDALELSYDPRYYMEGEELKDVYRKGNVAYLFLCQVLVGNQMYLTHTDEREAPMVTPKQSWWARMANQPPPAAIKVDSLKVRGAWNPDPKGNQEIDGCVWPMGKLRINWNPAVLTGFWGNLYVVYDEKRVIPRYLVKVEVTDRVVKEKIC